MIFLKFCHHKKEKDLSNYFEHLAILLPAAWPGRFDKNCQSIQIFYQSRQNLNFRLDLCSPLNPGAYQVVEGGVLGLVIRTQPNH